MKPEDWDLWRKVCETIKPLGTGRSPTIPSSGKPLVRKPKKILDLHGLTIEKAYAQTLDFIDRAQMPEITIITGKSGIIKKEFEFWLMQCEKVKSFHIISDGGAYRIRLRI